MITKIEEISLPPIIGFIGPINGGKTHNAEIYVKRFNYKHINFADMVRQTLYTILNYYPKSKEEYEKFKTDVKCSLTRKPLDNEPMLFNYNVNEYGGGSSGSSGPSAPASFNVPVHSHQHNIVHSGAMGTLANIDNVLNILTGRELLQNTGDGLRKLYGSFFWIDIWLKVIEQFEKVVCSDVRYLNEAFTILDQNGKLYFTNYPNSLPFSYDHDSEHMSQYFWNKYSSKELENNNYLKELTLQDIEMYGGITLEHFKECYNR